MLGALIVNQLCPRCGTVIPDTPAKEQRYFECQKCGTQYPVARCQCPASQGRVPKFVRQRDRGKGGFVECEYCHQNIFRCHPKARFANPFKKSQRGFNPRKGSETNKYVRIW